MTPELWTPIASMFGVVVGGSLAFVAQYATQRAAERAEERKRQVAMSETRRTEQVEALTEFIKVAHVAEGVAHSRPEAWHRGDEWYRAARPAMDELRISEKRVELLCHSHLQEPTAAYARALNEAVWNERDLEPIGDRLEPFKAAYLAAARRGLGVDPDDGS
jgi:hypothetical protein